MNIITIKVHKNLLVIILRLAIGLLTTNNSVPSSIGARNIKTASSAEITEIMNMIIANNIMLIISLDVHNSTKSSCAINGKIKHMKIIINQKHPAKIQSDFFLRTTCH
jgi:hypothetical protein